ncbi:hypothetical protein ACFL54_03645 [Planctomycetota bacterium]
MTSDKKYDPFKEKLRAFQLPKPSSSSVEVIAKAWAVQNVNTVDYGGQSVVFGGGKRSWFPLVLAAAGLLVVAGLWLMSKGDQNQPAAVPLDIRPSEKSFLFVIGEKLDSANPTALIHEMKDFEVVRKGLGEHIFEFMVKDIKPNGLGLALGEGEETVFYTREDLQKQFEKSVKHEVLKMADEVKSKQLSEEKYARLERFASMGKNSATRLLVGISGSDSPFAGRAQMALTKGHSGTRLDLLVTKALDTNNRYRENAIRGLGKVYSPITVSTLCRMVESNQEPEGIRLLALGAISTFDKKHAARVLTSLLVDGGSWPVPIKAAVLQAKKDVVGQ